MMSSENRTNLGKSETHAHQLSIKDLPLNLGNLARIPALAFIRFYQMTVSRALPPDTCRFYPTCSRYGYQAIYQHGLFRGGLLAAWRVLRCNPFNAGGIDQVQEKI